MKKALLIISLGLSLIVVGSIVTAYELTNWKVYDIEENSANLPVEKIKEDYSFEELDTETVVVSPNMYLYDYYGYDDIEDYGYVEYYGNNNEVEIVEDKNQKEGVFTVEMSYFSGSENTNCTTRARYDEGRRNRELEYHQGRNFRNNKGGMHSEHRNRREDRVEENRHNDTNRENSRNDTSFIHPICNTSSITLFDAFKTSGTKGFIDMLKNKEIPLTFNKMKIIVHPNDAHRIYR